VAAVGWIEYAYLAHFAQPKAVRNLYRLVKRLKVCRIVEVGISDLERADRLIRVAQRYTQSKVVAYTGLDWFDARPSQFSPLSLKDAHRILQKTGASVRLVPGEPARSLTTAANSLLHTDLLLIAPTVADGSLTSSWPFVPRMLDSHSVVLRERCGAGGGPEFRRLTSAELAQLARQAAPARAA